MRKSSGFTLIEILIVIAVLAILAGIVIGVQAGLQERSARSRAEGELAAIAAGLERYRTVFGDYPQIGPLAAETTLYGALLGQLAPNGQALTAAAVRPALIDVGSLGVGSRQVAAGEPTWVQPQAEVVDGRVRVADRDWRSHVLLDPWGVPYRYFYKAAGAGGGWENVGFVLLSTGPSGGEARERGETETPPVPANGVLSNDYYSQGNAYDDLLASP